MIVALFDDVKTSLRISGNDLDSEIQDLIEAAKTDLNISGVKNLIETDPLIKRAITVYCKANFGWDNPESEKLQLSYDMLKSHLSLCADYNTEVTTL